MPRFPLIATLAVALIAIVLIVLIVPTVTAQRTPPALTAPSITAVSPFHNNGWTVKLNDGTTFFVEGHVYDTAGRGPQPGPITDFIDQPWHVGKEYGGYATFRQGKDFFRAFRP